MPHRIAALADLYLLQETKDEIQKLFTESVNFPGDQPDEEQIIKRTGKSDVVLVSPGTKISDKYLAACPSVKHILVCGTSTANIDLDSAAKHNVAVDNITNYGDEAAAESIIKRLTEVTSIQGKQIGIIGLGAVGSALAKQAEASGMKVSYYSRRRKTGTEASSFQYKNLHELLSSSGIIALCGPGNVLVLSQEDFTRICCRPSKLRKRDGYEWLQVVDRRRK